MKQIKRTILLAVAVSLAVSAGVAISSDDDDHNDFIRSWLTRAASGIDPATTDLYVKECGSCHLPYQPGLLPATSWEKVMGSLDNHFGENAELAEDDLVEIRNFLLNNAAGRVNYGLPNKFMSAQNGRPFPMRITEMRYFVYKHSELTRAMVQDNPKVKSFSSCNSCHQRAKQGFYDEHDVSIPGFARWSD